MTEVLNFDKFKAKFRGVTYTCVTYTQKITAIHLMLAATGKWER